MIEQPPCAGFRVVLGLCLLLFTAGTRAEPEAYDAQLAIGVGRLYLESLLRAEPALADRPAIAWDQPVLEYVKVAHPTAHTLGYLGLWFPAKAGQAAARSYFEVGPRGRIQIREYGFGNLLEDRAQFRSLAVEDAVPKRFCEFHEERP